MPPSPSGRGFQRALRATVDDANDAYEKECKFYEEWHKTTAAKLHAAIAHTKGLGKNVRRIEYDYEDDAFLAMRFYDSHVPERG